MQLIGKSAHAGNGGDKGKNLVDAAAFLSQIRCSDLG